MTFTKNSSHGLRSDCGGYFISAGKVRGKWTYLAYAGDNILNCHATAEGAKEECRRHKSNLETTKSSALMKQGQNSGTADLF